MHLLNPLIISLSHRAVTAYRESGSSRIRCGFDFYLDINLSNFKAKGLYVFHGTQCEEHKIANFGK